MPGRERAAPVEDDGLDRAAPARHDADDRRRRRATTSATGTSVALTRAPVLDLDHAVGQAPADHDDGRHADQLGVLELDARARPSAGRREHRGPRRASSSPASRSAAAKTASSLPVATRCTSAGATSRGQNRPSSSWVLSATAATARRDADAVGAHGDRDELAVLVEHLQAERLGVLAAELEDVADLDAAGGLERAAADRAGVAVADLGRLDGAVRR